VLLCRKHSKFKVKNNPLLQKPGISCDVLTVFNISSAQANINQGIADKIFGSKKNRFHLSLPWHVCAMSTNPVKVLLTQSFQNGFRVTVCC